MGPSVINNVSSAFHDGNDGILRTGMDEVDNDHYFRTGKRLPNDSEWWLTMTVLMLIHP